MQEITQQEFLLLADMIYKICGIVIKDDKKYLIKQRFGPLLAECGCRNFSELYRLLRAENTGEELKMKMLECITTNETSFFRDDHPFETIKTSILPSLIDSLRKRRITNLSVRPSVRIWSAASSTGQEPYTVSILIREYLKNNQCQDILPCDFKILGTDISNAVLHKASKGVYNDIEIARGLEEPLKLKYFKKHGSEWIITKEVREMVEFKHLNLIKPFGSLGSFEFILCRNVLIYFDENTKRNILDQIYEMLTPGGFLMLGAMENTYCLSDKFTSVKTGKSIVYAKL